MKPTTNFQELSYKLHEKHNAIENGTLSELQKSWFKEDNVDYWRHDRMYRSLSPILHPNNKWITIGDGRFGLDSIKLKRIQPHLNVLPTDISVEALEYAKQIGLISNYESVNAEAIKFSDNEFDYALCKESFHHFPRPYMALYEMIRVSKKAVILIEPNEHYYKPPVSKLLFSLKDFIKKIIGKKPYHADSWNYEAVGNYIYSLSKREMEKVALGLNFPAIAFKHFNDYYEAGVEFAKIEKSSKVYHKVKKKITGRDTECKYGFNVCTHLSVIIFKESPDKNETDELKTNGFQIINLPRNPYVS